VSRAHLRADHGVDGAARVSVEKGPPPTRCGSRASRENNEPPPAPAVVFAARARISHRNRTGSRRPLKPVSFENRAERFPRTAGRRRSERVRERISAGGKHCRTTVNDSRGPGQRAYALATIRVVQAPRNAHAHCSHGSRRKSWNDATFWGLVDDRRRTRCRDGQATPGVRWPPYAGFDLREQQ